jgi:SAM-dependent methyltransferase
MEAKPSWTPPFLSSAGSGHLPLATTLRPFSVLPAPLSLLASVLTEAIAGRFAPSKVASIDASAQQIEFARAHRSQPNVSFETGDAMALPFADASFDVAVCGPGLNFIPEPERALREMRRVTVPNAIIAIYVWAYAEGARFLREFWDVAAVVDREALSFDQAQRFPLCSPERLRKLFDDAGLYEVNVRALDIATRFTSFDDHWQPLLT